MLVTDADCEYLEPSTCAVSRRAAAQSETGMEKRSDEEHLERREAVSR